MLEITSVSNEKIKDVVKLQQKKYRNEKGLFLIEGYKPISEAYAENVEIIAIYTTRKNLEKFGFIKDKTTLVSDHVMEKISTTDSVCEAVAVAKQQTKALDEIKNAKRLALIENIKDAGNLGTLIRSASAFSFDAIILCGDTIDIYNPKVIRSTVGCMFKIPIVKATLADVKKCFSQYNFIATVVSHSDVINPETIDYSSPFVVMLGSEADGLTNDAIAIANAKTTIPMAKNTESLNLSVAGSILFYIAAR